MGIDTCIYVKTKDGEEPEVRFSLPLHCTCVAATGREPESATHEIITPWRYWAYDYDRGPWPHIAAVLMLLFAAPNVETVWYFGDSFDTVEPFTKDDVLEFSRLYMEGQQP